MKIEILCGSIRKGRNSWRLANAVQRQLSNFSGVEAGLIDLHDFPLPPLESKTNHSFETQEMVDGLSSRLNMADAIILVSPEYNGSYSGVLKNALDYFLPEFKRKPMGVATASTGKFGGISASHQLQLLILALGAFPMPAKLIVPFIDKVIDENFNPDEATAASITRFCKEFVWFATLISEGKKTLPIS